MDENNIILKKQSGFRKNRQTSESFNRKKKVCAIFFDIQSAFDKVWHRGLVFKMIKLNIPNYVVCWINNFLTNSQFAIKINNFTISMSLIEAGVPTKKKSPTIYKF